MTNGCDAMNPDSLREYAKYVRYERRADIAERLDEFADQWRLQYDEWRSLGRRLAEAKGMADEWERQYDALRERLEAAEKARDTDAELLFQAGCVFALSENPVPAVRMFERAHKLGYPDAAEQLAALAGEVKP